MAPTQSTILTTFLLPPAPLPALISLNTFTALFPRAQQSSPLIKTLYRDLQRQRATVVDFVARNIEDECKSGNEQRRAVVRARRNMEREEGDEEIDVERLLTGPTSHLPTVNPHTLRTILPELEKAASDIEDEIRRLDDESDALLAEMQSTVSGLSDLRYGRFANVNLREQVLKGLESLEGACGNE